MPIASTRFPDRTIEPTTLVFLMPIPPQRANFRGSWQKSHGQKLRYWQQLDNLVLQKLLPRRPLKPWPHATITAHFTMRSVHMDQDNALARCKWAVDWLTQRHYLAGDTPSCLTWTGIPTQSSTKGTGLEPSLELTVTAL
jgi:hypothetical protein